MARPVFSAIVNSTAAFTNTGSFNVTLAANTQLVVALSWYDRTGVAVPTVLSITYNGAALGFFTRAQQNFATNDYLTTEIWGILAPATGSAFSLVWTLSEANDSGDAIYIAAYSVTGAAGFGPNVGQASGNSTAPSVTFTTTNAEGLIFSTIAQIGINPSPYTPGTGEVERADGVASGTGAISYWAAETNATAGSDTVSATSSASARWGICAVEILPAGGGGGVVIPLMVHHMKQQGMS